MKTLYFLLISLLVLSCDNADKNSEKSTEQPTSILEPEVIPYDGILSGDSTHLIEHILPNLVFDTLMILEENEEIHRSNITFNNYQRSIELELDGPSLISANIELRQFKNTTDILNQIHNHLRKFGGVLHKSQSFQNWILPLNDRPIIEINVFQTDTLISVDLHRRQHI